MTRAHSKPIVEVTPYNRKLDTNVVLDWILDIENFLEYENTSNNMKVKIVVTKLKGCVSLWWEHLQTDRQRKGKEEIKTWVKMVNNVKNKFLPSNYQVSLLRKIQNLRQRDMSVKDYIEIYKLDIRYGDPEDIFTKI